MKDIRFVFTFLINLPHKKDGKFIESIHITKSIYKRAWNSILFIYRKFVRNNIEISNIPSNKIWFFAETLNQYRAIEVISKKMENAIVVTTIKDLVNSDLNIYHIDFLVKDRSLFYFPKYVFQLFKIFGIRTFKLFDIIIIHFRALEIFTDNITKYQPKALILANDHNPLCRYGLLAFKKKSIKTFYVQHASVSNLFPLLDFDVALLDGLDSSNKYKEIGETACKIKLVGITKFDNHVNQRRKNKIVEKIGIGYNTIDDILKLEKLVAFLSNEFKALKIYIRPHPGDSRNIDSILNIQNVVISDSTQENSFDFIEKIDILIAGDTGLHLDATMMNVKCLYYNFSNSSIFDYYGFIKNEMIDNCENLEAVKICINKYRNGYEDVYKKASFFNYAIDSEFEGKSSEKVISIILNEVE